jgi:hypothetical protein
MSALPNNFGYHWGNIVAIEKSFTALQSFSRAERHACLSDQ